MEGDACWCHGLRSEGKASPLSTRAAGTEHPPVGHMSSLRIASRHCVTASGKNFLMITSPWYPAKCRLGNVGDRGSCFSSCVLCHLCCIPPPPPDAVPLAQCFRRSRGVRAERAPCPPEPAELVALPAAGARSELTVRRSSVGAAALASTLVLAATPLPSVGLRPWSC